MSSDPLASHKAAISLVESVMKAAKEIKPEEVIGTPEERLADLTDDAMIVYETCMSGGSGSDADQKSCLLLAEDFNRRHAGKFENLIPEVAKAVSIADMAADVGSPSSEVLLSNCNSKRKRLRRNQT